MLVPNDHTKPQSTYYGSPAFDVNSDNSSIVEEIDICRAAANFSLDPSSHITQLKGGVENLVFLIEAPDEKKYILRVYSIRNIDEVAQEVELLQAVNNIGYNVPLPIYSSNGAIGILKDRPYIIYPEINGITPQVPTEELAISAVRFAADMHKSLPPIEAPVHSMRNLTLDIINHLANDLLARAGSIDSYYQGLIEKGLERFCLYSKILVEFPRTWIHADLHEGNLLTNSHGKLVAVIDFDDSYIDCSALDIATIAKNFAITESGEIDSKLVGKIWREYSKQNPNQLISEEQSWLLTEYAAFKFSIFMTHSNIFLKNKVNPFEDNKNFNRFNSLVIRNTDEY